jgi:hypothetical protein
LEKRQKGEEDKGERGWRIMIGERVQREREVGRRKYNAVVMYLAIIMI